MNLEESVFIINCECLGICWPSCSAVAVLYQLQCKRLQFDKITPSTAPQLIEGTVTDPFLLNWLDLLCFLLSGLPANGTIAAEVAFMFNEWYRPNAVLEFPRGGTAALVGALVQGL